MKDDAPIPKQIPKKRRQIEQALDVWIATWLADESITPSERRRLEDEKERRKKIRAREQRTVGLLIGPEGVTPQQRGRLAEALAGATQIKHAGVAGNVHTVCRQVAPTEALLDPWTPRHDRQREVVKDVDAVVAMPGPGSGSPIWELVRYAKHRNVAVNVVLADGTYEGT